MLFNTRAEHVLAALRAIEKVANNSVTAEALPGTSPDEWCEMYSRRLDHMVQLFCSDQMASAIDDHAEAVRPL